VTDNFGKFRPRPVADPVIFLRQKTRPAKLKEERTRLECLYAHYRRWSHFADRVATTREKFEVAMRKSCAAEPYEFRGDLIFPTFLLDPLEETLEEDEDDAPLREPLRNKVRGLVRVVTPMTFRDEVCEAGEVLQWLEPTEGERRNLERMSKLAVLGNRTHLVVLWREKRRTVAGKCVERVQ
jgi:hypothetical protein